MYRRRFSRRKNPIYRTRRRFSTKKQRSNRLFRKFIRRTAQKSELKYFDTQLQNNVGANDTFNMRITPQQIGQGTNRSQRVGNSLKFVKCDIRLITVNNSANTGDLAPTDAAFLHRIIIWSPREDYSQAITRMGTTGFNDNLDVNSFTVYRDIIQNLKPSYMVEGLADATPAGNGSDRLFRKFSIKFPRKVHFGDNTLNLDEEKYSMYCTIKTQGAITFQLNNRTWFIDA